jgi:hypothetical protein
MAQAQLSKSISELEASVHEELAFVSTFGDLYRKRLWILQARNTRMGNDFYINYGFRNGESHTTFFNLIAAGSISQEVTEAVVWKDRVDTEGSASKEVIIIPARHRSMQQLRVSVLERRGSMTLSRTRTTTSGKVARQGYIDALENAQSVAFDTELYSLLVDEAESGSLKAIQPIVTPDSLSVVLGTFDKIKFELSVGNVFFTLVSRYSPSRTHI